MEISAKELREKPGKIIEQVLRGTEMVITLRGKKVARLISLLDGRETQNSDTDELFGMWQNRDDLENVNEHIRTLRKGRTF